MKSIPYYKNPHLFLHRTDRLTNFWRLSMFVLKGILFHVPSSETKHDILEFQEPATIEVQTEGENKAFKNIKKIEIKKSDKYIKVVHK